MASVLNTHSIEASTVSQTIGDQHVYVLAKTPEGVYEVNISPYVYERGAGYNWTKIPGVKILPAHVDISLIDPDPSKYGQYTEE